MLLGTVEQSRNTYAVLGQSSRPFPELYLKARYSGVGTGRVVEEPGMVLGQSSQFTVES